MLKIILLIIAVSVDSFAASIGIGSAGIKIPFRSAAVISLTGTVFLVISVGFADIISGFVPITICRYISSGLLIALGIVNLLHGILKKAASARKSSPALEILFDGTKADSDNSKTISCREALVLSAILSADSVVTGVSAGLGQISLIPLGTAAFAAGLFSTALGTFIGKRVIYTGNVNLQWLCGALLIVIALFF